MSYKLGMHVAKTKDTRRKEIQANKLKNSVSEAMQVRKEHSIWIRRDTDYKNCNANVHKNSQN